MNDQRTLLVAGATGAVGSVFVPKARSARLRVIPHVRPKTAATHPLGKDPDALVCDLSESAKLDAAMAPVETVVCLVGTMRRRFAAGDTYESSDYAPVVALVESAKRVPTAPGAGPRHFVLLSALGTRKGPGYPGWKWRAEQVVRESGLPFCIFRPSVFDSTGSGAQPSDGRERRPPPILGGALRLAGAIPGLRGISDDLRPMPLDTLVAAILQVVQSGTPRGSVLAGRQIRAAAQAARAQG